jgi:hypothetical protein
MSTLELIFGAAIVPLALLAVVAAFGWRYRQLVRAAMSKSAGPDALGATPAAIVAAPPPLTISRVDATDAPTPAGDAAIALADAAATTRKFRRVLIAAALTYILAIEAALIPFMTQALEAKVVAALMLPIPGLFVLLSFLRASWRQWLLIGAGYPMLAFAVATAAVGYERTYALVGALQVLLVLTPLGGLVLLVVRRLQPLLAILVAIIVYVSAGAAIALVLGWDQAVGPLGNQPPLLLAMAAAVHVLGLIIFGWLLRRQRIAWPVAGLVAMAVAGVSIDRLLQPSFPIGPLLVGLAGSVLQFSLVWGLFKLFVRLEDRHYLPDQVLHFHLCWAFLAFYYCLLASSGPALFRGGVSLPLAVLAYPLYLVVLHVSLRRLWRARARFPAKRLLFLRVFNAPDKRERLLERLDDTWRRIGRIDLIAGADLALRTLGASMLEAFLLRRVDAQFLKMNEEVDRRLAQLRSALEGDARYPINEIRCYASAWEHAVTRLAPAADVVLMDLRGFTSENLGCVYELTELIWHVALERVVLLTDASTDIRALEEVARGAWSKLPATSPNARSAHRELRVVRFLADSAREAQALARLLFAAASSPKDLAATRVLLGV